MNGTVKGLIAGVVALALLGGGFAVLKLTEDKGGDESSYDSVVNESVTLCSQDLNDVKSIDVENENGSYSFIRTYKGGNSVETVVTDASGVESTTTTKDSSVYAIKGLDGYDIDEDIFSSIPEGLATLMATKLVNENAEDMDIYGLKNPTAKIKVSFDDKDSTVLSLLVGSDAPSGDVYVALEGETRVYTVSPIKVNDLRNPSNYFISKLVLAEPPEEDYPDIIKLVVKRKNMDYDFVMEYDPKLWIFDAKESGGSLATQVITSPVPAYLDVGKSTEVTNGMFGLTAESVFAINADDDVVARAGLDDPFCTVEMTDITEKTYTLLISESVTENDIRYYYGMLKDSETIFKFTESSLPWVTTTPDAIRSELIFGTYVYHVDNLTVEADGKKTVEFDCSGDSESNFAVKRNGEEYDTDRYRAFFKCIISSTADELCFDEEPTGKLLAKVIIDNRDDIADETVEFYQTDTRKLLLKKNGVTICKCSSAYLENMLLPNMDRVDTDEDFITSW